MATRLILLVHGETSATRRAAFPLDEPLAPLGHAAAGRMTPPRCDTALTSPAQSARDTAVALGLDADVDEGLRDLATGTWAGRTLADVFAVDPRGAAAFLQDPGFAGHGGETIVDLVARTGAWLDDAGKVGAKRIVAVTHAAVVRAAILGVLGTSPAVFWRIDVGPLAMVQLTSDGRRWALSVRSP